MADKGWKARDRRILWKWFGTKRIPSIGIKAPDGVTENEVIEIFQYDPPKQFDREFEQAEREAGGDKVPWVVFGAKGSEDREKWIMTKLKYFPMHEGEGNDKEANHETN